MARVNACHSADLHHTAVEIGSQQLF